MTDKEILDLASRCIRWASPNHALMYDDELLMFARAILAAQLAAPAAPTELKGALMDDCFAGNQSAHSSMQAFIHKQSARIKELESELAHTQEWYAARFNSYREQLAAPVQQDAMLWRALVAIPPADIAEIAEWSSSSAEFIDRINERLLAAPQGEGK